MFLWPFDPIKLTRRNRFTNVGRILMLASEGHALKEKRKCKRGSRRGRGEGGYLGEKCVLPNSHSVCLLHNGLIS